MLFRASVSVRCPRRRAALLGLVAGALLSASPLHAQSVGVTVLDSITTGPLSGVVVTLLDTRDSVLARGLTAQTGFVRLPLSPRVASIRATRIGFRYQVRRFSGADAPDAVTIRMGAQPMLLDPVVAHSRARCSQRPDRQAALSLLEHARSGLLASVIAQGDPSSIVALKYRRWMDGISDSIAAQEVRRDSAIVLTSFSASDSAADYVRGGFISPGPNGPVYHAPDAAVLLDDAIMSGYCFQLADRDKERVNQVGLAFNRPDRRDGRVDVNGVLWIDTVARVLKDIQFRYVGLDYRLNSVRPGGSVYFDELRPGVAMVSRWHLRAPATDTAPPPRWSDFKTAVRAAELGAEIVKASWDDGEEWSARLGHLVLRVTRPDSTPAVGQHVSLENSDYRAQVDTLGFARFRELLPGPYRVSVADRRLAPLKLTLPTEKKVWIDRDSTTISAVESFTAEEYVARRCAKEKRLWAVDTARLLVRILPERPLDYASGIHVTFKNAATGAELAKDSFVTGADGVVTLCRNIHGGMSLVMTATRRGHAPVTVPIEIGPSLTIVPVRWP